MAELPVWPGDAAMADALQGLRVVDLTLLLPGPFATSRLAQWGAQVIKIEPPDGDGTREFWRTAADRAAGEPGAFYRALNAGKSSRRLDLRSEAGRAELLALVRDADALVEGFRPGVMQRLGLGHDRLRQGNPKLVICAITGYGQSGPWAQRAGHDINYLAMSGVLDQVATAGGEPAIPNLQIGDLLGGAQAGLSALLAALWAAQRTGRGRFVDVSMTHELLRHHVVARTTLAAQGPPVPGRELLSGGAPCYGVYRTADGRHVAVGALEPKFWVALCQALQRPQWIAQHWAVGLVPGSPQALQLRDDVAAVFATKTLPQWQPLFDADECCTTPVLRVDEALVHPVFASR
jgi:alpha-methylacyl-CoA racemase